MFFEEIGLKMKTYRSKKGTNPDANKRVGTLSVSRSVVFTE